MQFNLRLLLTAVTLVAVACAALATPGVWWAALFSTAVLFWLIAAVALAVGSDRRARAWWAGVLIGGVGYCLFLPTGWGTALNSTVGYSAERNGLITSKLLGVAFASLHPVNNNTPIPTPVGTPTIPQTAAYYQPAQAYPSNQNITVVATPVATPPVLYAPLARESFLTVGHACFAMLASLVGGLLAARAFDRRETASAGPKSGAPGGSPQIA
ncbi:hypothetical protein KOR34_35220 [Posidoniimonas corsicana]|uniref:Uncharacterized protein n=1 Tax=Posidoniimonas corsicana TaxID=1938618 RepID=A0A5C5V708_9BACT|nr:hypothetical protein [Posidoniimonas corsicana]TWT33689.1 hypothetical protein KOR34_35220 [Posidoniimonas corsicana]